MRGLACSGKRVEAPQFFQLFPMPLNEASRKAPRERWPLEFDLTGVPRDTAHPQAAFRTETDSRTDSRGTYVTRAHRPQQLHRRSAPATAAITDINNPPQTRYNPHDPKNEFPKMLYHHGTGRVLVVANAKEEKAALKRDFQLKPSPDHDYSKVSRAGIAAKASTEPKREEEMSAEELAALDEQDQAG